MSLLRGCLSSSDSDTTGMSECRGCIKKEVKKSLLNIHYKTNTQIINNVRIRTNKFILTSVLPHAEESDVAHTSLGARDLTAALHARPDALPEITSIHWQQAISD